MPYIKWFDLEKEPVYEKIIDEMQQTLVSIQRGNFFAITTSPIAMVFATVAILVIVYSVYNQSKINKRAAANAAKENA